MLMRITAPRLARCYGPGRAERRRLVHAQHLVHVEIGLCSSLPSPEADETVLRKVYGGLR